MLFRSIAAAGAAVALSPDGRIAAASIGLTAVGLDGTAAAAEEVLLGEHPGRSVIDEAARLAAAACDPVADQRGPIEYKRHLAEELTRRVLTRSCERAVPQKG